MKASELARQLEEILQNVGDVEIVVDQGKGSLEGAYLSRNRHRQGWTGDPEKVVLVMQPGFLV